VGIQDSTAEAQPEEAGDKTVQGELEREDKQAPGPSETVEEEKIDEMEELRQQAKEWRSKADELLDKYQRSVAEFSNYRKRQDRDREQQRLRLSMEVMRQLLPVMDDFDRALQNVPDRFSESEWLEGVELVDRKLKAVMEGFQVVPIEAVGKPFNPAFHSALMQQESDDYPDSTVMEELRRGYLLADQVLRPSLVKVSRKTTSEGKTPSRRSRTE
jgi:molecular chaperone GrpE